VYRTDYFFGSVYTKPSPATSARGIMAHPEAQRAPVLAPPEGLLAGRDRKCAPQCMPAGVGLLRDFFQTLVICVLSSQGTSGAARSGQAREHIVATRFSQPVFEYVFFRIDDESSICATPRFKPRLIVSRSGRRQSSFIFHSDIPNSRPTAPSP
jgi:hypothetical protein